LARPKPAIALAAFALCLAGGVSALQTLVNLAILIDASWIRLLFWGQLALALASLGSGVALFSQKFVAAPWAVAVSLMLTLASLGWLFVCTFNPRFVTPAEIATPVLAGIACAASIVARRRIRLLAASKQPR
jgi:hypothetical protein